MLKTLAILLATLAVTATAFRARLRAMHDHHDEKRWRPPHLAQMFTGKRNVDEGAVGDNGFIRFGKRSSHTPGNEFIRFGKKNDGEPGDNGFIRFGKRSDVGNEFIRFGKKTGAGNEFIRFGKSEGPDNQFIRFG